MKNTLPKLGYLLMVFILINIVECQNNKTRQQNQLGTTKSAGKAKVETAIQGLNCDTIIVSREFSDEVLAFTVFKADTNKIKSLFLHPATLKMEKQTNDQGGSYDLYHFTDGMNEIILLRNDGGFYMGEADIKNDKVLLNKKISIGMKKEAFLELLRVKNIKCDTINVTNEESTFESLYLFKDARLREIKML
ncbi:MAG: hypothetical protein ACXVJG_13380 [Mucilaginibacter sp.]